MSRFITEADIATLRKIHHAGTFLTVDQLEDPTPRTLVFGYTLERDTFHLYLGRDELFHRLIYSPSLDPETRTHVPGLLLDSSEGDTIDVERCIPSKRAYPARSDFEFAALVARNHEYGITFTNWERPTHPGPFYGFTMEDYR